MPSHSIAQEGYSRGRSQFNPAYGHTAFDYHDRPELHNPDPAFREEQRHRRSVDDRGYLYEHAGYNEGEQRGRGIPYGRARGERCVRLVVV